MDKTAPEMIDARKIIFTDSVGNQLTLHEMLELIVVNLTDLNEIVYDQQPNTTTH